MRASKWMASFFALSVLSVGACAWASAGDDQQAENTEALVASVDTSAPDTVAYSAGTFACERSIGPSTLVVRPDGTCFIVSPRALASSEVYCIAGACPPCWKLAKEVIGCALM